jgi:hypothetical protein
MFRIREYWGETGKQSDAPEFPDKIKRIGPNSATIGFFRYICPTEIGKTAFNPLPRQDTDDFLKRNSALNDWIYGI